MSLPPNIYLKENGFISCLICSRRCRLKDGEVGFCGNKMAKTVSNELQIVFREVSKIEAFNIDPIEKKPLYHFYPGHSVLSLGLTGCNMECFYCQNFKLSHDRLKFRYLYNENNHYTRNIVNMLDSYNKNNQIIGVAFTYSEPSTWLEFMYPIATKVKEAGYNNIVVSNGMMSQKALDSLLPFIDVANIDVKSFQEKTYHSLGGKLKTVLTTIKRLYQTGVHIELTYLVVPELNDDLDEIRNFVDWVQDSDVNIPIHFTRYFPSFKAYNSPTPLKTLIKSYDIAKDKLNHVYIGNILNHDYQTTYCPNCKSPIIKRNNLQVENQIIKNRCANCREYLYGIFR
ncbi:AmmeMemoRadiSam system radical SAM enzyme [Natranaerobius trueperi]|uniref:AmmeMemoRadiSam system radical SAM enzyme n=1 Tax=Natranaerobius trueperi TaxID=759412 RepID=A0A226C1Y4_9FIRM|nr:AmmeMemoRadiSam system radical SAM enzyme [Natranaerobius trueperi]OWZ84449.1 AmmeMemoRadiSam system radical SAM enzyme [Natranaerobius trueperi]